MSKTEVILHHRQSLMDIAIDHYGDGSYVFQLLADNPTLSAIDEVLDPGTPLLIDEALTVNRVENEFQMVSLVQNAVQASRAEVVVKPGQSLTDVVMEYYGDLGYVFQLLEDNPQIQSPETELTVGDKLKINSTIAEEKKENEFAYASIVKPSPDPNSQSRVIYEGQSVLDLALQEYGDISAAFELLLDSNTENIGAFTAPEQGTYINIRRDRVIDSDVATYYQNRNIKVNTGKLVIIEGIGLCSSDGVLLVSFDNFILKASDL